MKVLRMSVGTFAQIADNPRQRDTIRHARKAKKWLAESADTHRVVSIAELPNGERFKLDGHTRCHLWEENAIPLPAEKLDVIVYPCATMADVKRLYTHFDNTNATETASDRLSGACKEQGIELKSNLLKRYDFAQALKCVDRKEKSEYNLVAKYRDEVMTIDSWMLPLRRPMAGQSVAVHTCIKALAVALLVVGEEESAVHEFIAGVVRDEGTVKAGRRDSIAWASEMWLRRSHDGATSGRANLDGFLDELLWCYRMKGYRKNAPGARVLEKIAGSFKELVA